MHGVVQKKCSHQSTNYSLIIQSINRPINRALTHVNPTATDIRPVIYLWLCNVFCHWLRPCSAIDGKQVSSDWKSIVSTENVSLCFTCPLVDHLIYLDNYPFRYHSRIFTPSPTHTHTHTPILATVTLKLSCKGTSCRVFFFSSRIDLYSTITSAVLYEISCYIEESYNGTQESMHADLAKFC